MPGSKKLANTNLNGKKKHSPERSPQEIICS